MCTNKATIRQTSSKTSQKASTEDYPTYPPIIQKSNTTIPRCPKKNGYDYKLEYKPTINQNNKPKNNRKRKITWFNPPYSKHVASNISKQFLNLIDTCFPPTNKLHKILNRNTVKLSYRCMPNVKQIISNHNKTILTKESSTEDTTNNCNCCVKEKCPVDNKWQISSLSYQATVTRHDNS